MTKTGRDEAVDAAHIEAQQLLRTMRKDLDALRAFLDAEEQHLGRKQASAKRVARLRLMSQDLSSARAFSSKSLKG